MATDPSGLNIGISDPKKKAIADDLKRLLASVYTLQIKSQFAHFNIQGVVFSQAHALFGEQYEALAELVDMIAERIRALGCYAPAGLKDFMMLTEIKDFSGNVPYTRMLSELAQDRSIIVRSCKETVKLANKENDLPTLDLLTQVMQELEKSGWMLRATLD